MFVLKLGEYDIIIQIWKYWTHIKHLHYVLFIRVRSTSNEEPYLSQKIGGSFREFQNLLCFTEKEKQHTNIIIIIIIHNEQLEYARKTSWKLF